MAKGGFYEYDIGEKWLCNLMEEMPRVPSKYIVDSIFYSYAEELHLNQELKRKTYNFVGVFSWREVALQVLTAVGWRPDCAVADKLNLTRDLPPVCKAGAPIVIGNLGEMVWGVNLGARTARDEMNMDTTRQLTVEARAFFIGSYGFSCTYMRTPDGEVSSQGWVVGWDSEVTAPVFLYEFAILHGCLLALEYLNLNRNSCPSLVMITAG